MAKRRKRTTRDVPAKGRLRDFADQLWSHAVRDDWDNRCAMCGARNVEAHHIFPRAWETTRYDLRNGIALCPTHHKFDPDRSPHMCAPGFTAWIQESYPSVYEWVQGTWLRNDHKAFNGTKTPQHYIDVILELKQYFSDEGFADVVGKKFAAYLERTKPNG